jgi:ankyrin repeat protein
MNKKMIERILFGIMVPMILFFGSHFLLAADEIHDAVKEGNLNKVIEILENDPGQLNRTDSNGRTPLHYACLFGKNDVAQLLIKKGADIDPRDENQTTPLHIVAATGNLELVKILLDNGSKSINKGASWGSTPLHLACERGHPEVVSYLIDRGGDIESRNEFKRTPLIVTARQRGNLEIIKILVDKGADINARDKYNDTALTMAAGRGYKDVVNFLVEKKSVIPGDKKLTSLLSAAEKNLNTLYQYLIKDGLDLEKLEDKQQSLISSAASGGSVEILKSLVKKGFDPDFKDKDGWTPLHYAASQGKLEMIEYLIKIGVDKNHRNLKGETAYNLAVFREFPSAAEKLIKLGVDSSAPEFPGLKGQYMGQEPPGDKPKMFLPGIVSGHYIQHSAVVFSPDGKQACWTEQFPPREKGYASSGVMMMKMINGKWTYPEKLLFMKSEPFFSPDGKRLYFISVKPLPGKSRGGKENIWYMEKTGSGWSEPKPVDDAVNSMRLHWVFSLDKRGNLYFADQNRIFYAKNDKGKFKKPVDISVLYKNPTLKGFCPFISPDGETG